MFEPDLQLSVILPVRNGAGWIEEHLREVVGCLERHFYSFEVVAAGDGDEDRD